MRGLYLIPDREHMEESLSLLENYKGAYEYNDFFLAEVLDNPKRQKEIIDNYAKVRSDFSKDTMHGAFLDVTVHSSDSRIREISELRVRQSMDIAKEMGLRGVVFHTNRLRGFRDAVYLKNWVSSNHDFFARICEEYPRQQIFMENMFDESPDMLAELAHQMEEYANFGVCLDYAHASISGTNPEKWLKELAPYVRHMHINDNDGINDLHLAVGSGDTDWKSFSAQIESYGIEASVLVEVSGLARQRDSLEYMKRHNIFPLC